MDTADSALGKGRVWEWGPARTELALKMAATLARGPRERALRKRGGPWNFAICLMWLDITSYPIPCHCHLRQMGISPSPRGGQALGVGGVGTGTASQI